MTPAGATIRAIGMTTAGGEVIAIVTRILVHTLVAARAPRRTNQTPTRGIGTRSGGQGATAIRAGRIWVLCEQDLGAAPPRTKYFFVNLPAKRIGEAVAAVAYAFLQRERMRGGVDPSLTFPGIRPIVQEIFTALLFAQQPDYYKRVQELQKIDLRI